MKRTTAYEWLPNAQYNMHSLHNWNKSNGNGCNNPCIIGTDTYDLYDTYLREYTHEFRVFCNQGLVCKTIHDFSAMC